MSSASDVRSVVIAGGGVDGWTTAAALAHAYQGEGLDIRVLDLGTHEPFAAKPTAPISLAFHQRLGFDEATLMREAGASFSLGTLYRDWVSEGHRYFQPMGPHGASIEFVHFHNFANKARKAGDETPFNDYSLNAVAAREGRFTHPSSDRSSILSTLIYAHHLDTGRYTRLMRQFAEGLGVRRLKGQIDSVERDGDRGFIQALALADGSTLEADLYLDCSGREASLMQALDVGFEGWRGLLPADRLMTARGPAALAAPQVTVTGLERAWHQAVPTQNGTGHALVFRAEDMDDDEAAALLREAAGETLDSEPLASGCASGHREAFWQGNCVALGWAAVTFPPLDSAHLSSLQAGVMRLITLFPDRDCSPHLADEYNEVTRAEFANVRDFLLLHFLGVQRESSFWTAHRTEPAPESLAYKIRLFREHGQVAFYEEESYPDTAWASLWLGQDQWPKSYDPVLDKYDFERLQKRFSDMRDIIREAVAQMPLHEEYLRRFAATR
jgi:tryptophan halogenase